MTLLLLALLAAEPALGASADGASVPGGGAGAALVARSGAVGLSRMSTAQVGAPAHLRLGATAEFFRGSDFLVSAPGSSGDRDTRLRGTVSLGGTPWRYLELSGTLSGSANRNRRICGPGDRGGVCRSENGRSDPEVIRTATAAALAAKLAAPVRNGLALGGELGARLLPSPAGLAFDPDASSGFLNGLASWDLHAASGWPLRAHLSAGFFLDNSYNLEGVAEGSMSSRLVSAFAYGLGRHRLQAALGLEAGFATRRGLRLRPLLEYHFALVTADSDPAFAAFRPKLCGGPAGQPCKDGRDQHGLTVGLDLSTRGGFTVTAAADLALRSVGFPHGPPQAPYNLVLGVSQAFDLSGPRVVTQVVERRSESPPPSATGQISGIVRGEDGRPIDGAVVTLDRAGAGRPWARVASDAEGRFVAAGLPPGPLTVLVSAPERETARVGAEVATGKPAALEISLPRRTYPLRGRLVDLAGAPVKGTIRLLPAQGGAPLEVTTDDGGGFGAQLPAGRHRALVEARPYLRRALVVQVEGSAGDGASAGVAQPLELVVALRARPAGDGPMPGPDGTVIFSRPLAFLRSEGRPSAELAPESRAALEQLADLVLARPERTRLRVEATWDGSLPPEQAQPLTQQQARAVVAHLAEAGLERADLEAIGAGAPDPEPGQPRPRRGLTITLLPPPP